MNEHHQPDTIGYNPRFIAEICQNFTIVVENTY